MSRSTVVVGGVMTFVGSSIGGAMIVASAARQTMTTSMLLLRAPSSAAGGRWRIIPLHARHRLLQRACAAHAEPFLSLAIARYAMSLRLKPPGHWMASTPLYAVAAACGERRCFSGDDSDACVAWAAFWQPSPRRGAAHLRGGLPSRRDAQHAAPVRHHVPCGVRRRPRVENDRPLRRGVLQAPLRAREAVWGRGRPAFPSVTGPVANTGRLRFAQCVAANPPPRLMGSPLAKFPG